MADPLEMIPSRYSMRARTSLSRDFPFLELDALEVSDWRDDFQGDTLHGGYQSTASGTGAAAAAINTGLVNGEVRLDPGSADAGRSDLSLGLHYRGDRYPVVWFRFTTPAVITSWKFEFGFTDVVSGTDAGAVNAKATPTFNATDAVVLVRDTNDDTNLTLVGVLNGTAATAYDFTTVLAVSTAYYVGVALRDNRAKGFLLNADGKLIETQPTGRAWMESAVTATVLLTPWAFNQNRSASQRLLDIDYVRAYQRRTTTT